MHLNQRAVSKCSHSVWPTQLFVLLFFSGFSFFLGGALGFFLFFFPAFVLTSLVAHFGFSWFQIKFSQFINATLQPIELLVSFRQAF